MTAQFTIRGYNITTDPNFQNEQSGNSPEVRKQLDSLYLEVQDKNNEKIIDKLTGLIVQNPLSPQLKNYLMTAHHVRGNNERTKEINAQILIDHPDYLFGKINQAHIMIEKGEPEKVPFLLGEAMELKALYPGRDIFHLVELTGYYKAVVRYYFEIQNLELAENRLSLLQDIAPDHPDTTAAEKYVMALRLTNAIERWKTKTRDRITPEIISKKLVNQTEEPPLFNHYMINDLYSVGLKIVPEKIKEILALPRATLITDLESMLLDAENRYDYFENEDWEEETHSFILHAILFLTEIKATESLPKIISFLENDDEFLGFWLGDHRTDTLWRIFYALGFTQTTLLKQLLVKPRVDTYIKTSVSEALCQMVLHHPEKRTEILAVFNEVLTAFNGAKPEDNLIDTDFLGLAIGGIIDCGFAELMPLIKQLYKKKYVSVFINGDYNEVEKIVNDPLKRDKKMEIRSVADLYQHIITTWAGYRDDDSEEMNYEDEDWEDDYEAPFFDNGYPTLQEPVKKSESKIGRNDSCPCGSGKKYKKCHGVNK